MTQQELAEKLQITDKAVSKWERGLACPDISLLPQIAQIFGITVDDLLDGTPNGTQSVFRELNRGDTKEIFFLLCRCVSLALSVGGLVLYLLNGISVSDFCILVCLAVVLVGLDRFGS